MDDLIKKFKGVHPGLILDRILKKGGVKKGPLALSLGIYPQTMNEITKGKRGITVSLSLKLDAALGVDEGTMLLLQSYYEIKKEKEKNARLHTPNLSIIRKILFWDTDFSNIDWINQHQAILQRIFERGNQEEKNEIIRFYGQDKVEENLKNIYFRPQKIHRPTKQQDIALEK